MVSQCNHPSCGISHGVFQRWISLWLGKTGNIFFSVPGWVTAPSQFWALSCSCGTHQYPWFPVSFSQAETRLRQKNPYSCSLAEAAVVLWFIQSISLGTLAHATNHKSPNSESCVSATPESSGAAHEGMVHQWLNAQEVHCSMEVQNVLLNSRKPSTRAAYLDEWKCFFIWVAYHNVLLIQTILD